MRTLQRHYLLRRLGTDRGSTTTEVVLYSPLLMLLVLVGVQLAVWALAQLGVQHAANHALQTTRVTGGTAAAGTTEATTILTDVAGRIVNDPHVSVTRSPDTATVTLRGTVLPIVPFLHLRVSTTVTAPTERFRALPAGHSAPTTAEGHEGATTRQVTS